MAVRVRHHGVLPLVVCFLLGSIALAGSDDVPRKGSTQAFELLIASQAMFQSVASAVQPFMVRIETVGGAQPRPQASQDPTLDESDEDKPKRRRTQNQFRDTLGSRFVVADGPSTGLIYSADGYIITSSFNFVREPLLITALLADGRRLSAELVARDQVRKIALLKVDAQDLSVPRWRDVRDLHVGQWTIALGLGFGAGEPSINVGVISAFNRMMGNAFQTDAKLSPANYGGPVCDMDGYVLGLAVPMAQRPGELAGIELYDSGVGFAIPKKRVDEIVALLKTGRSVYRGWLGIQLNPRVRDAVLIQNIADPSPMREAGVQPGDRITGVNGKRVRHFGELVQALYMIPAGERVTLEIESAGRQFNVVVTLVPATELGPLPDLAEPFDPSEPSSDPDDE